MDYDDEMNSDTVDYLQKYNCLTEKLEHLIEKKTVKTTNTIFYDLITVSELRKILDESKENES